MIRRTSLLISFIMLLWSFFYLASSMLSAKEKSTSTQEQQQPAASSRSGASQNNKTVRPKRVWTEDDLRSGGSGGAAPGEVDISNVNDCDRNCRGDVFKGLVTPGGWDEDKGLARAVEGIRGDTQWQAALHAYAHYRVKFCNLEKERDRVLKAEPAGAARANLEYTQKEKALGDEMRRNVSTRWSDPFWVGNDPVLNLEARLTTYQVGRIMQAPCPASSER